MAATPATSSENAPALKQLKNVCSSLRTLLEDINAQKQKGTLDKAEFKQKRWRALVLLSAVKACTRETFVAADAWKKRVQDQKDVVEAHHLKLQNLLYEKDHLLREIRRCRGFSTKEMDKIEFEHGALPITVDADVHRQHLDQLTQELETRKRMIAQLKQLKLKIDEVEAATLAKQTFLDGLRAEVTAIEEATKPLQQYMGAPVSSQLQRRHEAQELPTPLYTLYCELEAYQTASGADKQIKLSVVDARGMKLHLPRTSALKRSFPVALRGADAVADDESSSSKRAKVPSRSPSVAPTPAEADKKSVPSRSPSASRSKRSASQVKDTVSEASEAVTAERLMALRPLDKKDDGDSGMAKDKQSSDQGQSMTAGTGSAEQEEQQQAASKDDEKDEQQQLWKPSEKALKLDLSLAVDGDGNNSATSVAFSLAFQYFPVTKIVTVEVLRSNINAWPSAATLTNLFPGDTGLDLPRLACNYEFMENNGEVSFPSAAYCRPYYWTQWVCGLFPVQRVDNDVHRRPEPSIRSMMNQLTQRLVASYHLKKHLDALAKLPRGDGVSIHSSAKQLFPSKVVTEVESWQEISTPSQDVLQLFKYSPQQQQQNVLLSPTGCKYFRVSFNCDKLKATALVEIAPEYPIRAPRFVLQSKLDKDASGTVAFANHLKDIEIEVNAFYNELIPKGTDQFLLMHQLRKIQKCLDLVHERGVGAATEFGRARRGKERRLAMVMDTASKELRHR